MLKNKYFGDMDDLITFCNNNKLNLNKISIIPDIQGGTGCCAEDTSISIETGFYLIYNEKDKKVGINEAKLIQRRYR